MFHCLLSIKKTQTLAFIGTKLFARFIKIFKCTKKPIILWRIIHVSFMITSYTSELQVAENQICDYFKDIKKMTLGYIFLLSQKVQIAFIKISPFPLTLPLASLCPQLLHCKLILKAFEIAFSYKFHKQTLNPLCRMFFIVMVILHLPSCVLYPHPHPPPPPPQKKIPPGTKF